MAKKSPIKTEKQSLAVPVEATTMGPDTSLSMVYDICLGVLVEGFGGDGSMERIAIDEVNQRIHDLLVRIMAEGRANIFHVCAAQAKALGEMTESVAEVIREKLGNRALN
jgi:hypothetical protein